MSNFCTNCGTALDENAKFCTNCGAAFESAAPAPEVPVQPVPETPVQPAAETAAPAQEAPAQPVSEAAPTLSAPKTSPVAKLLSNKKMLIGAVAAVAAVVILIVVLSLSGGKGAGYESAIDTYFDFCLGKISKSEIKSLLPDGFWTYKEEQENKTFDDYYAEIADNLEYRAERMKSEYGTNIKISYEITKEWTVSDRNQTLIAAALQRQYSIAEDDVTDVRRLELKMTIKGSEDEEDDDADCYAIKISGKWYLANVYLNSEETSVRFVAS